MGRRPIFKTPEQAIEVEYEGKMDKNGVYHTYDGHKITSKEEKFIRKVVSGSSLAAAYRSLNLGTNPNKDCENGRRLYAKPKISGEIAHRLDLMKNDSIADGQEIMEYFTKVMRGEEKDQFGLDAPLGERTSAAKELMKRVVELEEKSLGNEAPEIKITLNWERDGKEEQ